MVWRLFYSDATIITVVGDIKDVIEAQKNREDMPVFILDIQGNELRLPRKTQGKTMLQMA